MILSNEMLMQLNIELWKYMSNEKVELYKISVYYIL